ncbi:hypothetical protein HK096_011090, partial [Nowakowskiella sp. JEL0078]
NTYFVEKSPNKVDCELVKNISPAIDDLDNIFKSPTTPANTEFVVENFEVVKEPPLTPRNNLKSSKSILKQASPIKRLKSKSVVLQQRKITEIFDFASSPTSTYSPNSEEVKTPITLNVINIDSDSNEQKQ